MAVIVSQFSTDTDVKIAENNTFTEILVPLTPIEEPHTARVKSKSMVEII